jgi:adenylate kinase
MTAEHVQRLREMDLLPQTCLVLEVPDVVVEDRVAFRQLDPATGTLYHMTNNPAPLGVGARCITRPGESTHDMARRLAAYHAQLAPLLVALRQAVPQLMEMCVDVDVQESELEQVGEDIARKIDKEMA